MCLNNRKLNAVIAFLKSVLKESKIFGRFRDNHEFLENFLLHSVVLKKLSVSDSQFLMGEHFNSLSQCSPASSLMRGARASAYFTLKFILGLRTTNDTRNISWIVFVRKTTLQIILSIY